MRSCPHTSTCALFPVFTTKSFLRVWQDEDCNSTFQRCTRYQRSLESPAAPLPSPWLGHVVFLIMMTVGAFLSALARGRLAIHADLGADYGRLLASGWHALPVLAAGGLLVGFGTRMSGGCTSGH